MQFKLMEDVELNFKANDPGAVKFGNFINYYQFHPPEHRLKNFPTHLWNVHSGSKFVCLDIGCNSGNLTIELFKFLQQNVKVLPKPYECDVVEEKCGNQVIPECFILAVDLDPSLINRAKEINTNTNNVTFKPLDFMANDRKEVLSFFLNKHDHNQQFDVIFCFSVTMWIHLNHGDEGLKQFLVEVAKWTNMLVIEPQPWKCYRNAVRRLKRSSGETFPLYDSLKLRSNVEAEIEIILKRDCGFSKVMETVQASWGRQVLFFKRL